jgi:predicted DNA-binding ribbon-helix-helix protein
MTTTSQKTDIVIAMITEAHADEHNYASHGRVCVFAWEDGTIQWFVDHKRSSAFHAAKAL